MLLFVGMGIRVGQSCILSLFVSFKFLESSTAPCDLCFIELTGLELLMTELASSIFSILCVSNLCSYKPFCLL